MQINARNLNAKVIEDEIKEFGVEYVYISEHLECRPTHFDWQGTIVKSSEIYQNPINYGDVAGLCGINCRHYFEPYYGNKKGGELKKYSKDECNKAYELSQRQRYNERQIRRWKRELELSKESGDVELCNKASKKVKEWQNINKNFTKANSLKRKYTNEYVKNNKMLFVDDTKNWLSDVPNNNPISETNEYEIIDKNGNIIVYNESNAKFDTKDITEVERTVAKTIQKKTGKSVSLIHRINEPEEIKVPDLKLDNKYFDIKSIRKSKTEKSKMNKVYHAVDDGKKQANNFVINLLGYKECDLTNEETIEQIKRLYSNKFYDWVDCIILIGKDDLFKVYKKK